MLIAGFLFPDELSYLVEHQTWARFHGDGTATVGITSMGIRLAGEIYMCRPKGVGADVEPGRSIAVVELAKSVVSVKSPVRGVVIDVNPVLEVRPEAVHLDPYGEGWLARLRLAPGDPAVAAAGPAAESASAGALLVSGVAAAAALAHHAWLNQLA